MKIGILGLGFVGLTSALSFADKNFQVYANDINEERTNKIKSNKIPFHEPFLKEKLKLHLNKKFQLIDKFETLISLADIVFICVGTPSNKDGSANLKYIENIFLKIKISYENQKKIFCIKSTIPPGTCSFLKKKFDPDNKLSISFCPEFLREGFAWNDFNNPDRVVVGLDKNTKKSFFNIIFKKFTHKIFYTNLDEAELLKYVSNSLLANLISFSNEISMIANKLGNIDIKKLFYLSHMDKRWFGKPANMSSYFYPGLGYGGYCLPKDLKALISTSEKLKFDPIILKAIDKTNNKIKKFNLNLIIKQIPNKNLKIGFIGLSFKEGSDDVRDTPSSFYIENLIKKGYRNILAYDDLAMNNFKFLYPNLKIRFISNIINLFKISDILILMKKDKGIEKINLADYKNKIIDLKYLF